LVRFYQLCFRGR